MGFTFVSENASELPAAVRKAADAVCQLKTADSSATTATNIARDMVLTAGHTMQFKESAALMLAVYNLRKDRDANSRQVFGLHPYQHRGGFHYSRKSTEGSQNILKLNDEKRMDFAICRVRQSRQKLYSGDEPRGFVKVAAPPHGTLAQEQVFLIAHQGRTSPFQAFSVGTLTVGVGEFFFAHTAAGQMGDSGAPVFDVDGNLIGIHVANVDGVKIACRADKILAALNAAVPDGWK